MITVRDLAFGYDDGPVLDGLSLDVATGETLAVMGANGSGKTTLLKLLAGLYEPDRGTIDREGVVGFAPEDPRAGLFAETVAEEVAFFPRNRDLDVEAATDAAMTAMDVSDLRDRGPYTLSAGEQRRVSIAAVLAGDPAVVALDEPTAGLDAAGERYLAALLSDLDATVVFSTHSSDFAYRVADRVALMGGGALRETGDARDLLADPDLLREAGVRVPGAVTWARKHGFDPPPESVAAAVALVRGAQ